jgi:hypothetical protein
MSNLESLTPSQLFALSKVVKTAELKSAREQLAPGEHIVPTFAVQIDGNVSVSEDEEYVPTTSISLIGAACLAIRRMGIQREAFLKVMKEVCTEALTSSEATRAALMLDANVKEFETAFKAEFTAQLPKASRKGKTRVTANASTL